MISDGFHVTLALQQATRVRAMLETLRESARAAQRDYVANGEFDAAERAADEIDSLGAIIAKFS